MDRNRKHIAYILLYYNAYNDTLECINSLIKLNNSDCDVSYVIVNNASPDGSFPELKSRLQNIPNVYFIETKDNIGFARGNNTGIRFAKNKLNADFVIALNTDTVIEQIDFNNEIIRLFKEEQYYVLGPKVMSYNSDRLQSPIGNALENKPVKRYIENKLRLLLWETGLIFLLRRIRKPDTSISDGTRVFDKYHCVCSGCCLIFSPGMASTAIHFYTGKRQFFFTSLILYSVKPYIRMNYRFIIKVVQQTIQLMAKMNVREQLDIIK